MLMFKLPKYAIQFVVMDSFTEMRFVTIKIKEDVSKIAQDLQQGLIAR